MKKLLLLFILTIFGVSNSNAQISFSHAGGGKYYVASVKVNNETFSSSAIGALYSPRLNFAEVGDNSTISIGTHLGLAFEATSSSRTGSSSSFVYDIPLVAEYNFGFASSTDNDDGFGFYAGGGYGIHNSSVLSDAVTGPIVNGGLRFAIADRPLDLNVSYLLGSDDVNVLGIGLQYTFGMR